MEESQFLSDRLIKLGAAANRKNNRSQAEQVKLMLEELAKEKTSSPKYLKGITKQVVKILNGYGFPYYKLEMFFKSK